MASAAAYLLLIPQFQRQQSLPSALSLLQLPAGTLPHPDSFGRGRTARPSVISEGIPAHPPLVAPLARRHADIS